VQVNFASLEEDAAGGIQKMIDDMNGALSDFEASVNQSLLEWEGDAREAYYTAQAAWSQAAANITLLLNACKDGVITANEEFMIAEMTNVGRF
jgi:WXG100 family type VII secretion target